MSKITSAEIRATIKEIETSISYYQADAARFAALSLHGDANAKKAKDEANGKIAELREKKAEYDIALVGVVQLEAEAAEAAENARLDTHYEAARAAAVETVELSAEVDAAIAELERLTRRLETAERNIKRGLYDAGITRRPDLSIFGINADKSSHFAIEAVAEFSQPVSLRHPSLHSRLSSAYARIIDNARTEF